MKGFIFGKMAAVASLSLALQVNAAVIFDYSSVPAGDQAGGPYLLGLNFQVNTPITVNALGAFDSLGLGFSGAQYVQVGIYQYTGTPALNANGTLTPVTPIVTFNSGSGNLPDSGGAQWNSITPTLLTPGSYAVLAANYTQSTALGNRNYNTDGSSVSPVVFDNLGGAISLIQWGIWSRGSSLPTTGFNFTWAANAPAGTWDYDPATGGTWGPHPQPTYAAGTFSAVVPEPSTVLAGSLLLLPFAASTIRFARKHRQG